MMYVAFQRTTVDGDYSVQRRDFALRLTCSDVSAITTESIDDRLLLAIDIFDSGGLTAWSKEFSISA